MSVKRGRTKALIALHIMLMVYSVSAICSKLAAQQDFLSVKFCLYYGIIIILLGLYAIGWQQIIKHLPLTTAYANKAVTVAWGLVWGRMFFDEKTSMGKLIGAFLVILGVVLYAFADRRETDE